MHVACRITGAGVGLLCVVVSSLVDPVPAAAQFQAVQVMQQVEEAQPATENRTKKTATLGSALKNAFSKLMGGSAAKSEAAQAEQTEEPEPVIKPIPKYVELPPDEIQALVRQLGDESFEKRTAAAEKLAQCGLYARDALLAGLKHNDVEIRRACRRLLTDVLEVDFQKRLNELALDVEGKQTHDVPCWDRYAEMFGSDKTARELFVKMQRAEPALLASAEAGGEPAAQAFKIRAQQLQQAMYSSQGRVRREPSLGSIAALLYVTIDPKSNIAADSSTYSLWTNYLHQQALQKALKEEPYKDIARKMLTRWIVQPSHANYLHQKLTLAIQYDIQEALYPAMDLLKAKKTPSNYYLGYAVEAVARLGGKPYAAALAETLGEERECTRQTIIRNGKQEQRTVQVRDVALAWLVDLTGQDHKDYNMPNAKTWIDTVRKQRTAGFNFSNYGFANEEERKAALKKWEEWVKKNPLPPMPKRPASVPENTLLADDAARPVAAGAAVRVVVAAPVAAQAAQAQAAQAVRKPVEEKKGEDAKAKGDPKPDENKNDAAKKEDAKKDAEKKAAAQKAAAAAQNAAARIVVAPAMGAAVAQVKEEEKKESDAGAVLGLPLADRFHTQKLNEARRLIERKLYASAVSLLGDLLSAKSDYAYRPDHGSALYRRIKPAAERLIGEMPPEGRAEFEVQFGALARRRLDEAVASGNVEALDEVVQSFFYTDAGAEAAYLLGTYHRLEADYLRAAHCLQRLAQDAVRAGRFQPALGIELASCYLLAGEPQLAEGVLVDWKADQPAAPLISGERREPFASSETALDWLQKIVGEQPPACDDWAMLGGNPARSFAAEGGNPWLTARYKVGIQEEKVLAQSVESAQNQFRQQRLAALPSLYPLVLGETVVVRTATDVRALDLATGKLRWLAPLEDPLQLFLRHADDQRKQSNKEILEQGLRRRLWEDTAFGAMSSDGRLVFGLESVPFALGPDYQPIVVLPNGRRQLDPGHLKNYNLLAAYDVRTGKAKWELGGPPSSSENRLAGAMFHAAPLPVGDRLFVLADIDSATRLLALEPATGEVLFQLTLSDSEREQDDVQRQMVLIAMQRMIPLNQDFGASPSYADGVLVCRVASNRFVAVDLASRRPLWGYEATVETSRRARIFNPFGAQAANSEGPEQWRNASPTIAEGRVLLTPPGGNQLICLDLADGTEQWTARRRDGLYVGGVHGGKVVVVGRSKVWAVDLHRKAETSGEDAVAWELTDMPMPSGQGYLADGRYYLPLVTSEVAAIDVASGRLVSRSRASGGFVPGNLVSHQGAIVSLSADGVCRFDSLDERDQRLASQLKEKPDDAALLADRGEVLLYQGQIAEAVDHLRRAMAARPEPRTRQLLVDAVAQGLRGDFEAFRTIAVELDPLFDTPELRSRLLREMAFGYQRNRQVRESLDAYLRWIDLFPEPSTLEDLGGARTARTDRLIQGGLVSLRAGANAAEQAEIDRQIQSRLTGDRIERFLPYFSHHPASSAARLQLAAKLAEQKRWIEAEHALRRVLRDGDERQRREAVARLADLLREAKSPQDAAEYYRQLAGPLADQVCLDGRTGRAIVDALPADDAAGAAMAGPPAWPSAVKAEVAKERSGNYRGVSQRYPLWVTGGEGRFHVSYETGGQVVAEFDPQGQMLWKIPVTAFNISPHYQGYMNNNSEGRRMGHLVVVLLGNRVCAIDSLSRDPKLLWAENSPTGATPQAGQAFWPPRRLQVQRQNNRFSTPLAVAATEDYVCFEQDRRLVAVDPLTGRTLWTRDGIAADSDLWGDEELLFVAAPGATEATVLSGLDGRELGMRDVPPLDRRMLTLGRSVLVWESANGQSELRLLDPWQPQGNQEVWKRAFHSEAQTWLLDAGELAVFDPEGNFEVVSTATGKPVVQAKVDKCEGLESIVALRMSDRYLLVTNCPTPEPNIFGFASYAGIVKVGGKVYAFKSQGGKKLWEAKLPDQCLNVNQPADLPVLTFFRRYQKAQQLPNGGYRSENPVSQVYALDTRTGAVLANDSAPGHDDRYQLEVDRSAKQIEVRSSQMTVKFTFSEAG